MNLHGAKDDPYRILFPLGIVLGTLGVSIWPLYYYGVTQGYSGRAHAFVQIDGFLYAFIAGFLLTAVPRFTGAEPVSRTTQYALAAMIAGAALAFEFQFFTTGQTVFLAVHVAVVLLAAQRFRRRKANPPETFPLVGFGLAAGLIGAAINAAMAWNVIAPAWDLLGKRLLTEGMTLMLVLGVGGFLGPRLLGFASLAEMGSPKGIRFQAERDRNMRFYAAAGLGILASLAGEYGFGIPTLAFVRAGLATIVICVSVQPWRRPAARTTLAWCVWTALWFVMIGVWLAAAAPRYRVDFLHVLFIGGFTLLIVAIATRVTLSHGGHGLAEEQRSWTLRTTLAAGLIAMLARIGAPFSGFTYFAHLAWAAWLWIGGMLLWGFHLLRWIRTARYD